MWLGVGKCVHGAGLTSSFPPPLAHNSPTPIAPTFGPIPGTSVTCTALPADRRHRQQKQQGQRGLHEAWFVSLCTSRSRARVLCFSSRHGRNGEGRLGKTPKPQAKGGLSRSALCVFPFCRSFVLAASWWGAKHARGVAHGLYGPCQLHNPYLHKMQGQHSSHTGRQAGTLYTSSPSSSSF